jgi:hypothetical protein
MWGDWLHEAIACVPVGNFEQNLFRASLFNELAAALVRQPAQTGTPADVVMDTTARMQDEYPDFHPRFHARLLRMRWPTPESDNRRKAERARLAAVSATFSKLR